MSAAEDLWIKQARQVGCIIEVLQGKTIPFTTPPEHTAIHHIDGQTKPGAHFLTIPLNPYYHQNGPDARHVNKKRFEALCGDEMYLLECTRALVARYFGEDAVKLPESI